MSKTIEERNIEKKKTFDEWMKDDHVLIQLDARQESVAVPENLKADAALTLKLSYLFQGRTLVDEKKITSYLLFGDQYFECIVPWTSIWGIRSCSGEQKVWSEEIPKEIITKMAREKLADIGKRIFGSKKDEKTEDETDSKSSQSTESPGDKPKPHLKRIK